MTKGELLKYYRQKLGMKVTDIISRCKSITVDDYIFYETDKEEPSKAALVEIARALNISPREFISSIESQDSSDNINSFEDNPDWSENWSEKYTVLKKYKGLKGSEKYIAKINGLVDDFSCEYQYSDEDTFLALKDILYNIYKEKKEAQ